MEVEQHVRPEFPQHQALRLRNSERLTVRRERGRVDRGLPARQCPQQDAGSYMPEPDTAVACSDDERSVRREGNRERCRRVARQHADEPAGLRVPEGDFAKPALPVPARRREQPAVG